MTATRPYTAPAHTRTDPPLPTAGTTFHVIGDVHAGATAPWRMDSLIRDVVMDRMPAPTAVLQVGDGINDDPAYTPMFKNYMDRVGKNNWYAVLGNHDVFSQTPAQWATSMGYSQPSRVLDLPGLRLIFFSVPDAWTNYNVVSTANLSWLDSAIGGTSNPVFVICHFPIYDTIQGTPGVDADSKDDWVYIKTAANPGNSNDTLAVLSAHTNVKAWIAGHTHSRIELPGLVMPVVAGGRRFASINASSPYDPDGYANVSLSRINSIFVTWLGDAIEVRFRDHGAGQWASPNTNRVFRVTGLG